MLIIELLKTLLFGIVEGITEWLPVSSTGHLILLDEFVGLNVGRELGSEFNEQFLEMFNVVIQLGAIMAVPVLFWNKLNPFSKKKSEAERKSTWSLLFKVAVGVLPAAAAVCDAASDVWHFLHLVGNAGFDQFLHPAWH